MARQPHRERDLVSQDNKIYSAAFDRTLIKASMPVRALGVQIAEGTAWSNADKTLLASTRDLWMLFVLEQDWYEHPTACDQTRKAELIKTAKLR